VAELFVTGYFALLILFVCGLVWVVVADPSSGTG